MLHPTYQCHHCFVGKELDSGVNKLPKMKCQKGQQKRSKRQAGKGQFNNLNFLITSRIKYAIFPLLLSYTLKPIGDDSFWEEGSNLVEPSTDTPVIWKLVSAPSVKCCRESCIGMPTPQTCIGYIFHLTEQQCVLKMTQKSGKIESNQEATGSSFTWMNNISNN